MEQKKATILDVAAMATKMANATTTPAEPGYIAAFVTLRFAQGFSERTSATQGAGCRCR